MNEIFQIIKGTPFYVWSIGIKSMKTRVVYIPTLFIPALIVLAIKYKMIFSDDALVFCLVMMGGRLIGLFITTGNTICKKEWAIELPGSFEAPIILISIFIVKYYFGYLKFIDPDLLIEYFVVESMLSGLFSGYFIGRALRYTYQYLKVAK